MSQDKTIFGISFALAHILKTTRNFAGPAKINGGKAVYFCFYLANRYLTPASLALTGKTRAGSFLLPALAIYLRSRCSAPV